MRKLSAIAALLLVNGGLLVTAPPAYAHCDNPHGPVETTVCRLRCYEYPDPWKCPSPLPDINH